jgi:hypothetical protein
MFKLKIYDQRSMLFNQMKNNKYHRTLQNLIPISYKERCKCEIFQIDGRTKWWNRSAQERKKETMKERIKR